MTFSELRALIKPCMPWTRFETIDPEVKKLNDFAESYKEQDDATLEADELSRLLNLICEESSHPLISSIREKAFSGKDTHFFSAAAYLKNANLLDTEIFAHLWAFDTDKTLALKRLLENSQKNKIAISKETVRLAINQYQEIAADSPAMYFSVNDCIINLTICGILAKETFPLFLKHSTYLLPLLSTIKKQGSAFNKAHERMRIFDWVSQQSPRNNLFNVIACFSYPSDILKLIDTLNVANQPKPLLQLIEQALTQDTILTLTTKINIASYFVQNDWHSAFFKFICSSYQPAWLNIFTWLIQHHIAINAELLIDLECVDKDKIIDLVKFLDSKDDSLELKMLTFWLKSNTSVKLDKSVSPPGATKSYQSNTLWEEKRKTNEPRLTIKNHVVYENYIDDLLPIHPKR